MSNKLFGDTFVSGIFWGLICVACNYAIFFGLRLLINQYTSLVIYQFMPGGIVFSLLVSILTFRYIMVNRKKEEMGKGFLFALTLLTFGSYLYYYKFSS